jgi:flagellar biosynthesis protein FlhG
LSHLIAVCSGKGGVGKTFTCINLAAALRDLGKEVLIVDADMGLGNAQLMLGVSPKLTLSDYVLDGMPLAQVVTQLEEGLQLLPGASGDANIVNLPLTSLSDLCHELVELYPDTVVLFDIAAGISDQNMHLLRLCETRIVIFLDEPTSIADSYGVLKLLHRSGHLENTFLVPNQVASLAAGKTFYEKMNHLCLSFLGTPVEYLGSIQEDLAVRSSIRHRNPLHKSFPNSTAWCNIKTLATKIVSQDSV